MLWGFAQASRPAATTRVPRYATLLSYLLRSYLYLPKMLGGIIQSMHFISLQPWTSSMNTTSFLLDSTPYQTKTLSNFQSHSQEQEFRSWDLFHLTSLLYTTCNMYYMFPSQCLVFTYLTRFITPFDVPCRIPASSFFSPRLPRHNPWLPRYS